PLVFAHWKETDIWIHVASWRLDNGLTSNERNARRMARLSKRYAAQDPNAQPHKSGAFWLEISSVGLAQAVHLVE
ncbi:hypothetical protein, partial [Pseudomonas viridiflava]|uniref:hypothetical protein n=1 Tax=Pseudomonas viridiflava TaxID=33069 RepID=UPI00197E12CE